MLIAIPLIFCVIVSTFAALRFTAVATPPISCTVYVDPPEQTVYVCQNFTVDINIMDLVDPPIYDYEIFLHYNASQMTPVNAWDGGFLSQPVSFGWFADGSPVFCWAYTISAPRTGATGSGTLATVEFHCDGTGDCLLGLEVYLSDENETYYEATLVIPGTVYQEESAPTHTYIDPPEYTVPICIPFTVNVMVQDVVDLYAYYLNMSYNTASVDCLDIVDAGFIPQPISEVQKVIDDATGTILYTVTSTAGTGGTSGSGAIATITFHCTGAGESILNLDCVMLVDSTGLEIPTTVAGGRVIQIGYWEPIKLIDIVEWPYPYYLVDIPFVPPGSPEGYLEVKTYLEDKGYVFDPADGTASEVTMFTEDEESIGSVTSWWSNNTLEDGTRACMLSYENDDPDDPGMAMGFVTNLLPPEQIPEVDPYIIVNAQPYLFVRFYWWAWYPIGRVVWYSYWWYDSHSHPNWFWGPYWWWRIYTRAYYYPYIDVPYWRPWWGWWWHWIYWRHWHWWSTYFPYDP